MEKTKKEWEEFYEALALAIFEKFLNEDEKPVIVSKNGIVGIVKSKTTEKVMHIKFSVKILQ